MSDKPGKHRLRETAPQGKHRAAGEPADPITDKRAPGASLATRPMPAVPGLSEHGQRVLDEMENR